MGREPQSGPRAAEAPARHARGAPARRRGADPALGHGMAVPAPMVEEGARTPRHPPVHEPQGQLPGQRGGRAGVRPLEGRSSTAAESSTRSSGSRPSWTPTSSIGTPDDARYDSRDAPRRSSGACPPRSDPVSQLTTSNKRGAIQSRGGVHRLFLEAFGFFWWWS